MSTFLPNVTISGQIHAHKIELEALVQERGILNAKSERVRERIRECQYGIRALRAAQQELKDES